MDLELLKTFLEVHRVSHFGKAAENLFVTPSAVSARIRQLEEQLGVTLFNRTRNNIHLTSAGERLLSHAAMMVNGWEKARYDIVSEGESASKFSILAVPSLWDTILLPWVAKMRLEIPELMLRLEAMPSETIWRKLQQNRADLGFVLEPQAGPELQVEEVSTLELIMVSTQPQQNLEQVINDDYIMVEWGGSFMTRHAALFPQTEIPATWVSTGRIAFDMLQAGSGSGSYLPEYMVRGALKGRRVFLVKKAPVIRLSIYAAYPAWSSQQELINRLLSFNNESS
ncbi:MAG: LysR family transcriptional regulator [Gammaproteobacteria bacterium]|nr:LysR family transcriptional regulator [Gammaproteobacteria bacterium]